jgi:hypothetical protein
MSIDPRFLVRAPARVLRQPSTRQAARVTVSFAMVISLLVGLFSSGVIAVSNVGASSSGVAANLDQCADGGVGSPAVACSGNQWVNGNLNGTKAQYKEGDAIPYRATMTGLSIGAHTITFQWQTTKSGLHALDYITTWNREPSLGGTLPTGSDPCSGVSGCVLSSASTFAIPADGNAPPGKQAAGVLTLINGTIASVDPYVRSPATGFPSGDNSTSVTVHFNATSSTAVLAWGGHIAAEIDWCPTTLGCGAGSISGSPFHTALQNLDGVTLGSQDRALATSAVAASFITTTKVTSPANSATNFNFSLQGGPTGTFSGDIFQLNGVSPTNTRTTGPLFAGSYTDTESNLPLNWQLTGLSCAPTANYSQVPSSSGGTATINLAQGAGVTCTFTDTFTKGTPTISTTLSGTSVSIGTAVHDSSTLSNATAGAGGSVTYTVYSDTACKLGAQDAGTKTVSSGVVPDSNAITLNTAGTFYWQAVYSGDANNNGATSPCTSEVLVVGKNSPSISTTLSGTSVGIGTAVHDSSTLSGATAGAGGSVSYTVYSDTACTLGAQDAGTKTVSSGVVPDSNAITFNTAGTFYWQAVYSGDANNNGATSACTSEVVVVNPNTPLMSTAQNLLPNDSATLTGLTSNAGGTVTFNLYNPSAATCGGTPAFTQTVPVNGAGTYNTTNIAFVASDTGEWRWQVTYSGDGNNTGATSSCGVENFTVTNQ